VSPLVLRVGVEPGGIVTIVECDAHATEELDAIRARLEGSTSVFEGTRFELRGFDVCMITGVAG
jgi:hypothetical protein